MDDNINFKELKTNSLKFGKELTKVILGFSIGFLLIGGEGVGKGGKGGGTNRTNNNNIIDI